MCACVCMCAYKCMCANVYNFMCGVHVHVCVSAHVLGYTEYGSGKGCKRKGKGINEWEGRG